MVNEVIPVALTKTIPGKPFKHVLAYMRFDIDSEKLTFTEHDCELLQDGYLHFAIINSTNPIGYYALTNATIKVEYDRATGCYSEEMLQKLPIDYMPKVAYTHNGIIYLNRFSNTVCVDSELNLVGKCASIAMEKVYCEREQFYFTKSITKNDIFEFRFETCNSFVCNISDGMYLNYMADGSVVQKLPSCFLICDFLKRYSTLHISAVSPNRLLAAEPDRKAKNILFLVQNENKSLYVYNQNRVVLHVCSCSQALSASTLFAFNSSIVAWTFINELFVDDEKIHTFGSEPTLLRLYGSLLWVQAGYRVGVCDIDERKEFIYVDLITDKSEVFINPHNPHMAVLHNYDDLIILIYDTERSVIEKYTDAHGLTDHRSFFSCFISETSFIYGETVFNFLNEELWAVHSAKIRENFFFESISRIFSVDPFHIVRMSSTVKNSAIEVSHMIFDKNYNTIDETFEALPLQSIVSPDCTEIEIFYNIM
ncbi:hypothetical protein PCE1_004883 [Barthelona sp. PCE]